MNEWRQVNGSEYKLYGPGNLFARVYLHKGLWNADIYEEIIPDSEACLDKALTKRGIEDLGAAKDYAEYAVKYQPMESRPISH